MSWNETRSSEGVTVSCRAGWFWVCVGGNRGIGIARSKSHEKAEAMAKEYREHGYITVDE